MFSGLALMFLIFVPGNTLIGRLATFAIVSVIFGLGLVLYLMGAKAASDQKIRSQVMTAIVDSVVDNKVDGEIV
jgi:Flp pilus assembly protein TadB